ncbi:MAG: glutamyl-tRNA reductase [Sulfurimonas sp.]|jgi:glutamyl-tRNA reductase|uniref:glutamyl-tRNA reductase n=1 Tax=Sulfurimonas sp. TaxID=2022749 RepID=UPI0039E62ADD
MHYLAISFSHKNSSIDIREKLSYPNESDMHGCLKKLNISESVNEAMLISTCNRMEVLCSCNDVQKATEYILNILSKRSGIIREELESHADIFDDSSAIHHVFSVASSLDSMVIGETQIAGQLKDAFRFAHDNGYCSKKLARTMKSAFKCAAKVRNATDISSKPVSIASVAVSQIKSLVDLKDKKALVIGIGEMSEITAKHLLSAGADVYITNRTKHKAEELASTCGAKIVGFEELPNLINEFEILFTATSSPIPIITYEMVDLCNFERYWFDLALPRDIESFDRGDIHLFAIDNLKLIVDENRGLREKSARAAQGIIGREIVTFFESLASLDIEPVIKEIYQKAYKAAAHETARVMDKGFIPSEYEKEAKKMCEQAIKRFLHDMTSSMRNSSDESGHALTTQMMHIFSDSIDKEKPRRPENTKGLN